MTKPTGIKLTCVTSTQRLLKFMFCRYQVSELDSKLYDIVTFYGLLELASEMNQPLERKYFLLAGTAVLVLVVGISAATSVSGAFRYLHQSVRNTATSRNFVRSQSDGKNGDSQPQTLPAISAAVLERHKLSVHRKHVAHQAAIAKALASRLQANALGMPSSLALKSTGHT